MRWRVSTPHHNQMRPSRQEAGHEIPRGESNAQTLSRATVPAMSPARTYGRWSWLRPAHHGIVSTTAVAHMETWQDSGSEEDQMDSAQLHARAMVIDLHNDTIVAHIRRGNWSLADGECEAKHEHTGMISFMRGHEPPRAGADPIQINLDKMRRGGIDMGPHVIGKEPFTYDRILDEWVPSAPYGRPAERSPKADFERYPPNTDSDDTAVLLHIVLDNVGYHRTSEVLAYATTHRIKFYFTPTNASWLNRIECHFTALKKLTS